VGGVPNNAVASLRSTHPIPVGLALLDIIIAVYMVVGIDINFFILSAMQWLLISYYAISMRPISLPKREAPTCNRKAPPTKQMNGCWITRLQFTCFQCMFLDDEGAPYFFFGANIISQSRGGNLGVI
jgi:hypothetical protein